MTNATYKKMTLKEMKSRQWKTSREITSGVMSIPAGTVVSITGKGGGLQISGPKCPHCGVSVFCRKVDHWAIEEILS
jgi:hypothetical protein